MATILVFFVCIKIWLAGLVFEWKIQKNILTQTRLARQIWI